MKILSNTDNEELHRKYRDIDEYRYYQAPLYKLLEGSSITPTDIWFQSDLCISKFQEAYPQPECEVPRIYQQLTISARHLDNSNGCSKENSEQDASRIADLIFAVTASRMLENEDTDNHPSEIVESDAVPYGIIDYLRHDKYFKIAIGFLNLKEKDFMGRDYVFANNDWTQNKSIAKDIPSVRKQSDELIMLLIEKTSPLKELFADKWDDWGKLWKRLSSDKSIMELLSQESPHSCDWGKINKKLVCNVIGQFTDFYKLSNPTKIDKLLKGEKGKTAKLYISTLHPDGKSCILTKEQINRIKKFLED